jgi:GNAT superfamily N-acetyltransferase
MSYSIRKAVPGDRAAIEVLIKESVRGLSREDYDARQIELSIETVFGVDDELIRDGTYFIAETGDGILAGCGGWSRRKTLYGASRYARTRDSELLDPARDAAKIRAFFIHPDHARRGVGTLILEACEREARAEGFRAAEMMATLPGVKLYAARGYTGEEETPVPVGDGVSIVCIKMRKSLA